MQPRCATATDLLSSQSTAVDRLAMKFSLTFYFSTYPSTQSQYLDANKHSLSQCWCMATINAVRSWGTQRSGRNGAVVALGFHIHQARLVC